MDEKKLEETLNGICDKLSAEQREKVMACENLDEFMKLAGEWGLELPDELVTGVAGGAVKLMSDDLLKKINRFFKFP